VIFLDARFMGVFLPITLKLGTLDGKRELKRFLTPCING